MDLRKNFVKEVFLQPKFIIYMIFLTLVLWGGLGLLFLKAVAKLELDLQYWPVYVFIWFSISLISTVSIFNSIKKMLVEMTDEYQDIIDDIKEENSQVKHTE